MSNSETPKFVYVSYIRTTAEALWQALVDPAIAPLYWSGYQPQMGANVGDDFRILTPDGEVGDDGVMLEIDPPHRLSYTFHHVLKDEFAGEPATRVTFTLEPMGNSVKLTLVHDEFVPDSKLFGAIQNGWPAIVSSLKSYLETGTIPDLG